MKMKKQAFLVAQFLFFAGFLTLLFFIGFGIVRANIGAQGNIMLSIFWGKFTFVDIYIAFLVFYLWVAYKEKSLIKKIIWFVLIMGGGSMAICLYMFIALRKCNYDLQQLLMGRE